VPLNNSFIKLDFKKLLNTQPAIMDTTEIARLQAEITRLNRIIDALIAENTLLKQGIPVSQLSEGIPNSEIPLSQKGNGNPNGEIPLLQKENGNPNGEIPVSQKGTGNTNDGIPLSEKGNGNTNDGIPLRQSGKGNTNNSIPLSQKGNGNPIGEIPLSQKGKGNPTVQTGNPKEGNGNSNVSGNNSSTPIFKPNPEQQLAYHLFKHLNMKTKRSGRNHSAKLLLHFYHSNRGSHAELMKVTGLTIGGLTKKLEMFKKRGWLVRSGWQQFTLTDVARKIVTDACGENI